MSEKGGGRGGKQGSCGAGGVFCVETKRASIARVGLVAEEGGARRPEPPPLSWSALLIVNESRVEAQQESIDHLVAEVGGCAEIWFGDRERLFGWGGATAPGLRRRDVDVRGRQFRFSEEYGLLLLLQTNGLFWVLWWGWQGGSEEAGRGLLCCTACM